MMQACPVNLFNINSKKYTFCFYIFSRGQMAKSTSAKNSIGIP